MRTWLRVAALAALLAMLASPVSSRAGGGGGGTHLGVLFAGFDNGMLYRSVDDAASWQRVDHDVLSGIIYNIVVTDGVVYAAAAHGVYRSSDGGTTWRDLHYPGIPIWVAAASPPSRTVYVVGAFDASRSNDGGDTWVPWPIPQAESEVRSLVLSDRRPATMVLIQRDSNRTPRDRKAMFESADGGQTWRTVAGLPWSDTTTAYVYAAQFDSTHPAVAFAATDWGMYRTVDSGRSWHATSLDRYVDTVAIDPTDSRKIVAGAIGVPARLYYSRDGGSTWEESDVSPEYDIVSVAIDVARPTEVLAGSRYRLYGSDDGGVHWRSLASALPVPQGAEISYVASGWL